MSAAPSNIRKSKHSVSILVTAYNEDVVVEEVVRIRTGEVGDAAI